MIGDHNCSQICVELEGSFSCSCYSGYELLEDKANCGGTNSEIMYNCNDYLDIDECTQGLAGCDHDCTNTPGSFFCACMNGFELLSDNRSCAGKKYIKFN